MTQNDGSYTWTVDDAEVLNNILNAKNGEQFVSDEFKIGEIRWKIGIRPNGINERNIGSFLVFLKLSKLPETWQNIFVCRTIESPQTKSSVTKMATYGEGESFGWKPNTLLLKHIKAYNLDKLIIKINVKMLEIRLKENGDIMYHIQLDYDKKQQLKWILDTETLNALKMSNYGKCSSSNILNGMWVIEIYPNGDDKRDEGKFNIGLRWVAMPKNVSKLEIEWIVSVKQFNFKQSLKGEYALINPGKIVTAGSFEEFKKCDSFEIIVDILIVRAQRIERESLSNLDRYMISEQKDDFREETFVLSDKDNNNNNNDDKIGNIVNLNDNDREFSPSQSMAVQFQIYQNTVNQQIKTLREELNMKAQEIEERIRNENNNNGQEIDNTSNSEWEQKQNEQQFIMTEQLNSYQSNIDDQLSLYHQEISSLQNELNEKTKQIEKLLDVNQENQQQIKSLINVNKNKKQEIKIINDKLKEILNEDKNKKNKKNKKNDNNDKGKDMMIEINKLKQEIKRMNHIKNNKKKGMDIMRKIRIGFGTVCLIGGIGYIIHHFVEKNKDSDKSSYY